MSGINQLKLNIMKHYKVKIVDGYFGESMFIHFWGILSSVIINNKIYKTINNEYNVPLFIEGLNTISIEEF